jgi:hypothetical protein
MPLYRHNNYRENQRQKSTTQTIVDEEFNNQEEIPHVKLDDSAGNNSKVIITDGTNDAGVNADNQLHVVQEGKVDDNNSTSTPLGIDGVWTGTSSETLSYAVICISVYSDVASATDGFCLQFSTDDTNWYDAECFTVPADNAKTYTFQPEAKYYRSKYTNGGTGQTAFRLQITLKKTYIKPSSHRIQDEISDDDDAELTKAVLTGKTALGNFVNFSSTNGGNFKISLEELDSPISSNNNTQLNTTVFNSSGTELDILTYEGENAARISIGHKGVFSVHFDSDAETGTQGFMLVDLSDTTNWPHTNTNHIVLEKVIINVNPSSTPGFVGDLSFGFLSNVDATNGDYHRIGKLHGDRGTPIVGGEFSFDNFGFDLESANWFGPTTLNDTTWQTDVNLLGPDGNTSYPSGDGDFVMYLDSTAGSIDIAVTVFYVTK